MIKMVDVYKSFGKLEVLKGINFNVTPREVVCVIGPSGSGKKHSFAVHKSVRES